MAIWKKETNLETINENCKKTVANHLGIVFTEVGPNFLIASMPVDQRTIQPAGILSGGATLALAETVGSVAALMAVDNETTCVGLEMNANHLHSIKEGFVFAKASVFHIGKMTQVWQIKVNGADGKLISICRLTLANLAI
ncbi:MAG: hotdog fold thioesterase [Candidatus Margulisbacteria bacterium]|nr:hotdog fold thioesterase [Candidatus Margulisiibacteriota bacterium]